MLLRTVRSSAVGDYIPKALTRRCFYKNKTLPFHDLYLSQSVNDRKFEDAYMQSDSISQHQHLPLPFLTSVVILPNITENPQGGSR